MKAAKLVRDAQHAGSWYTDDPEKLDQELTGYLGEAKQTVPEGATLKALIGPHAGFRYSGPTAAWAYKNIAHPERYKRVLLLGPSHKVYLDFVATTACDEWATPLGNLGIDSEAVERLVQSEGGLFQRIAKKHEENEHSLEMHAPFIRKVFAGREDLLLLPLMVGQLSAEKLEACARVLAPFLADAETLVVVSSDFCHWGARFDFTLRFGDDEGR